MKAMQAVRNFIIMDIAIGTVITIVMWKSIGMEGMAAKFCSLIDVKKCHETEWSDEYDPEK